MKTVVVTLHDGSRLEAEVHGAGPAVLLPVNPTPLEGAEAEAKRQWGVDPALGRTLIDGLQDRFTVVAFDYEDHLLNRHPQPDTLTPDNMVRDILAVAAAAGVDRFAYYGYSWMAVAALQLAVRTDCLWALIMGGFPPIDGPYAAMLTVTRATHAMTVSPKAPAAKAAPASAENFDWDSIDITLSEAQTRQFVTLYEALQGFDDRAAQARLRCPRLCFAGSADKIAYGERWHNAVVDIAGPFLTRAEVMRQAGWEVQVLDGLDHTQAMQPAVVLPIIRPWLLAQTG